jgi:hypothetical protein
MMPSCPACRMSLPDGASRCPGCGASVTQVPPEGSAPSMLPTLTPLPLSGSPSRPPTSAGFPTGTVFAGRFRIVTRLGGGGMGEVYRADDLKLGQTVALKFLARELEANPKLEELFRSEVRLSREVTHPNVCRVHDIGEAEGRHFLTMELVDGEDLGSLLKRIGRLPAEKAIQVSRQICAGLAAAHEKGVLHRDLKPANIMLDGRGRVRITDFGLALLAGEGAGDVAGTPAYMAPELFDGRAASVQSDIYALGLVLYEIFTGRRAFEGKSFAVLRQQQAESTPSIPSTLVPDLDPAVERVIVRCLEKDPAERPASVAQVSVALPGGDPLAAALAAGETPSPELVAAAGQEGTLRPWVALLLVAGLAASLMVSAWLWPRSNTYGLARLEASPDVLAGRARQIAKGFGYPAPGDRAYWIHTEFDFIDYHLKAGPSTVQRRTLPDTRPGTVSLHYRETPRSFSLPAFMSQVTDAQPSHDEPGMVDVHVDGHGRLQLFQAVPPDKIDEPAQATLVDWRPVFEAAGLDPAGFREVTPTVTPPVSSDERKEWVEAQPKQADKPMRVGGAAFAGRVVWFDLIGPWEKPAWIGRPWRTNEGIMGVINLLILLGLLGLGVFLVRRNLKTGRGDRRGALRVAGIIGLSQLASWLLSARAPASTAGYQGWIFAGISLALGQAGFVWAVYLGIEPYVRRKWPHVLIGWSRLLTGRWRDPLVGRDVLTGVLLGLGIWVLNGLSDSLASFVNMSDSVTQLYDSRVFPIGTASALGWLASLPVLALSNGVFIIGILFVLRLVLRRDWLAAVAFALLLTVPSLLAGNHPFLVLIGFCMVGLLAMALVRWGLLAFSVCLLVNSLEPAMPILAAAGCWVPWQGWLGVVVVGILAAYGFKTALGNQQLLPSLDS